MAQQAPNVASQQEPRMHKTVTATYRPRDVLSKRRIVQGTHYTRTNVLGHIGRDHIVMASYLHVHILTTLLLS